MAAHERFLCATRNLGWLIKHVSLTSRVDFSFFGRLHDTQLGNYILVAGAYKGRTTRLPWEHGLNIMDLKQENGYYVPRQCMQGYTNRVVCSSTLYHCAPM
jgi:hypothetical protein